MNINFQGTKVFQRKWETWDVAAATAVAGGGRHRRMYTRMDPNQLVMPTLNYFGKYPDSSKVTDYSEDKPSTKQAVITRRTCKDKFCAFLFVMSILLFIISAWTANRRALLITSTTGELVSVSDIKDTFVEFLVDWSKPFALVLGMAIVLGSTWIVALRKFSRMVVYGSLVAIPVSAALSIYFLIRFSQFVGDETMSEFESAA